MGKKFRGWKGRICKKTLRYPVITMACCLVALCIKAQDFNYVQYDMRGGLAGNVVYHMVQDHDGFMWFGTETGLSRFDGTHFKNFTTSDGLPDNEIIRLFVDSKNRVWIVPFGNTLCYYWRGTIYTSKNDSLLKRLNITSPVSSIAENSRGDLAFVQSRRITVCKQNGEVLHIDGYDGKPFATTTYAGIKDSVNFLFNAIRDTSVYAFEEIYEYDGDSLKILQRWNVGETGFNTVLLDRNLAVLVTLDSLYFYFDFEKEKSFSVHAPGLLRISRLNDSLVVINTVTSVRTYNIYRRETDKELFSGNSVTAFFTDSEGNWWFSTIGSGVYRLASVEMKTYSFVAGEKEYAVWSLEKDGPVIYAGTDNFRLWKVDLHGKVTWVDISRRRTPGRIMSLDKLPDGGLVIGTDGGLFKLLNGSIHASTLISSVKSSALSGDTMFFATSGAIYALNTSELREIWVPWKERATTSFITDGELLIGTLNGLYILDRRHKINYAGTLHPSLKGRISCIAKAQDGSVWIGTYGYGLAGYKNGKVFATLTEEDGLTSNICRSLFVHENTLWVGTDKGLNKVVYARGAFTVTQFTRAVGLKSDMINAILVHNDTVYAGTPAGLTFFNEKRLYNTSTCALKITRIQSADSQWDFYDGSVIPLKEKDIRVEFAGISFKSGGEMVYRYRLPGIQDSWQVTRDNFLSYAALPSGAYELQLIAVNRFGKQSDPVRIRFVVEKQLWEKWWLQAIVLLILGLLIRWFVRYRVQKVRREEAEKTAMRRRMAELEQSALKAQMNPHFIFNSLHSIQQYVMDNDVTGANKYISDFARLIRLTLDISPKAKITLQEEIDYLSTYLELEKTKFNEKFTYAVDASGIANTDSLFVPAMLLQPFVENSIRHGVFYRRDKKGVITVSFRLNENHLECTVEDNGVGLKGSQKLKIGSSHQSKGIDLIMRRIEMLNKILTEPVIARLEELDETKRDGAYPGTRVTISMPLQDVLKPE